MTSSSLATSLEHPTTRPDARDRLRTLTVGRQWWIGTLAVYALTRLAAFVGFRLTASIENPWPDEWTDNGRASAWSLMTGGWDGTWYRTIAEDGYPDAVPYDSSGQPVQSPLPFYPLFPLTARLLSALTGIPAPSAGVLLSVVGGLVALVLLRALILERAPDLAERHPWFVFTAPLVTVAWPSAGVLSANYSEGTALVLLLATLLALARDRVWLTAVLILLLGLVRPLAVPLGLVVLAHHAPHLVAAWRQERRVLWRRIGAVCVLGTASVVSVLLWPVHVALLTGEPTALATAQSAWKRAEGSEPGRPLSVLAAETGGTLQAVLVIVCMLVPLTLWMLRSPVRRVGREVVVWTSGYLLFLLVTVGPSGSTLRYLLVAPGLTMLLAGGIRRGAHAALLLGTLTLLQVAWILLCWGRGSPP